MSNRASERNAIATICLAGFSLAGPHALHAHGPARSRARPVPKKGIEVGGPTENRFLIEKARSFPALVRMLRVPRARAVVPRWMPRLDGDTADTMGHVPVKIRGGSSKALANGRDPRLSILSTSLLVEGDRVLAGP